MLLFFLIGLIAEVWGTKQHFLHLEENSNTIQGFEFDRVFHFVGMKCSMQIFLYYQRDATFNQLYGLESLCCLVMEALAFIQH